MLVGLNLASTHDGMAPPTQNCTKNATFRAWKAAAPNGTQIIWKHEASKDGLCSAGLWYYADAGVRDCSGTPTLSGDTGRADFCHASGAELLYGNAVNNPTPAAGLGQCATDSKVIVEWYLCV